MARLGLRVSHSCILIAVIDGEAGAKPVATMLATMIAVSGRATSG
jgi:hypothetical protein